MKTKTDLQKAVNDLREVCRKHGVVLIGTCASEGIYGEITIGEIDTIGWTDIKGAVDNKVVGDDKNGYCLGGIGDIKPVKAITLRRPLPP